MPIVAEGQLRRTLGVSDAVVIGAGSMIGAGVFAAWSPAADAAGTGLLIGLAIAGVIAFCNATSSAELAAKHPRSGGTYVYGREQLGHGWGHLAGWGFVVGKTASCIAMALTVGAYLWPEQERLVAVLAAVVILLVNIGGLSRTVAVTKVLLTIASAALLIVLVSGWSSDGFDLGRITPLDGGPLDWLRAAGFMFFAFAGYARIATLGEEVKDPETTIPRAIPLALFGVLALYLVVGVTTLGAVDTTTIAATDAPLRAVVDTGGVDSLAPVVRIGAGIAALGVLLNLIPGISRVALAMARNRELPPWFAHIDARRDLPLRAEITVAAVVVAGVLLLDLRSAIGISGVAVLTYYAVTNAAALTLRGADVRFPPVIAVVGLIGCIALVFALPTAIVASGLAVLLVGVGVRQIGLRLG